MTARAVWRRLGAGARRASRAYDEIFASRWRQEIRREAAVQQDTLRALVLLDALGVDNPVAYETLDAIPYLVADLHSWHQRMGQRNYGAPEMCC